MTNSSATLVQAANEPRSQPADPLWTEHGFALTATQAGTIVLAVLLACLAGALFA